VPGTVTYEPEPVPLNRKGVGTAVFRFHADAEDAAARWEPLPNVRLLGISAKEGGAPWVARIRFALGDRYLEFGEPRRLEDVMGFDTVGPGVLEEDDRVVAFAFFADGTRRMIFSGFYQAPQGDLSEDGEFVTATVLGDTVREADNPLAGAILRDADDPTTANDLQTGSLPVRFNPDGQPNASPYDEAVPAPHGDSEFEDNTYPVFLGPYPDDETHPQAGGSVNQSQIRAWTLPMAARYIVVNGAIDYEDDGTAIKSKYVDYGKLGFLDDVLTSVRSAPPEDDGGEPDPNEEAENADRENKKDVGVIDPNDPDTYIVEDILCPDLDVTGMPWPDALWRLIEPYGFGMAFLLQEDDDGEDGYPGSPKWTLDVFRKDYSLRQKALYLQRAGNDLDPGRTNLRSVSLARDGTGIANTVALDAAPVRVECSFVLVPAFPITADDITNKDDYIEGNPNFTGEKKNDYRLFIFDECGEGHWKASDSAMDFTPGKFEPAFLMGRLDRYWAIRRRPGHSELISVDSQGVPLRATIHVSFDYASDDPEVWQGDGTWQEIVSGEWKLCDDRLGIYLTAHNINDWQVAKVKGGLDQLGGSPTEAEGTVKMTLVKWFDPASTHPVPRFRVTCCVDMDDDFNVVAPKRASSPSKFTVTRRVDVKDRYRKDIVSRWSQFSDDFGGTDKTTRDDSKEARGLADMYRRETEVGSFSGPAVVPRFSAAYHMGDQITKVDGRDIKLRMNAGAEQGEAPVYPVVVGMDYSFDGEQSVTLTLSDHRTSPPPRRGARRGQGRRS
jgi:hypothetical protein